MGQDEEEQDREDYMFRWSDQSIDTDFSVQYTQHSAVTGNFSILHLPFYPEPFGFVLNE